MMRSHRRLCRGMNACMDLHHLEMVNRNIIKPHTEEWICKRHIKPNLDWCRELRLKLKLKR
jgi:hypothetical protein